MTRKIITGVIAAVLVITIAVFAAEKAKEKKYTEKSGPRGGERGERFERHEALLDQLAEAYKANDREKMGKIIAKMQERREKMREFVKINRWHKWAHRRMMEYSFAPNYGAMQGWRMGPGWGHGPQMGGPGWNRGWAMRGQDWNQEWAMQGRGPVEGCPMAGPRWQHEHEMRGCGPVVRDGMDNCEAAHGRFEQMQPDGMGAWGQPYGRRMPMRGWGRGFQRHWSPESDEDNMGQQEWNMPRHERQNVPPPEWGW